MAFLDAATFHVKVMYKSAVISCAASSIAQIAGISTPTLISLARSSLLVFPSVCQYSGAPFLQSSPLPNSSLISFQEVRIGMTTALFGSSFIKKLSTHLQACSSSSLTPSRARRVFSSIFPCFKLAFKSPLSLIIPFHSVSISFGISPRSSLSLDLASWVSVSIICCVFCSVWVTFSRFPIPSFLSKKHVSFLRRYVNLLMSFNNLCDRPRHVRRLKFQRVGRIERICSISHFNQKL